VRILALLISLIYPACAGHGAHGLPMPGLMDMAHLARPASPNTALAAPAGFIPAPDIVTPVYPVPAAVLFAAIQAVATGQARTFPQADFAVQMQADWVVRSAVFNFPDLVTAQVQPHGGHASTLVLYSRSVYGYSDFGVNHKRVQAWLAALAARLPQTAQR